MDMTLDQLTGHLTGTWRTYLRPDELYDGAALTMDVEASEDGWLITYEGPIKEDDVTGSMRIRRDGASITWNDTWHTEGADAVLTATDGLPSYQYGPTDEPWTWSIDIRPGDHRLEIIHYNAPPGMEGAVAVVMELKVDG